MKTEDIPVEEGYGLVKKLQLNCSSEEMDQNLQNVKDWHTERCLIKLVDTKNTKGLDQVAVFVANTLNKICLTLVH